MSVTESEYVVGKCSWPQKIFAQLNGTYTPRQRVGTGKDFPIELTHLLRAGANTLKLNYPHCKFAIHDDDDDICVFAIEVIEILHHSVVIDMVWEDNFVEADLAWRKIKTRLGGSNSGDGRHRGQQQELTVDLTDTFTGKIFAIPARGADCTHVECFDLESWLLRRPHAPTDSFDSSSSDKWRCPICTKDARPYRLVVDGFLLGVRRKLKEQDKLRTTSITVSGDGTWEAVSKSGGRPSSDNAEGPSPEIIIIDDDDD